MTIENGSSVAEQQMAKHLRRNGLNPDGTPIGGEQFSQDLPSDDELETNQLNGNDFAAENIPIEVGQNENNQELEVLRAELAKYQRDYQSVVGRVAPMQQEVEASRKALAEAQALQAQRDAETARQMAELKAQIEEQARKNFNPRELLTDDEAAMIDETQLAAITKIAGAMADRGIAQVRADQKKELEAINAEWQERQRVDKINSTFANPEFKLDWVQQQSTDPVFNNWLMSEEGALANFHLMNLLRAPASDVYAQARKASKELEKFPGHPGRSATPPASAPSGGDLPNRLSGHVQRHSNIGTLNEAQTASEIARAKQLTRLGGSKNLAEAQAILEKLDKANAR